MESTKMGQKMGRLPDTWSELIEEKNRVLLWSSEILARVDDNIKSEDIFLMDYDNVRIDAKVDRWIANQKPKLDDAQSKFSSANARKSLESEVAEVADDIRHKMRRDYHNAYAEMKRFTKRIDAMAIEERAMHAEVQSLEIICADDPKLLMAKLGPLRKKVFGNLHRSEQMGLREKKLRTAFARKVYDVDRKYIEECATRIDKLVKDLQQSNGSPGP